MMVRMRRRITHAEYLAELEDRHVSLERLARKAEKKPALRPLVDEWRWLATHPERAEEQIVVEHDIVFHDFERFLEVVSPQRLRMLQYLREHPATDSLSDLARGLGRDYRNVHEDASRLAEVGVIRLDPKGNRVVPRLIAERIEVEV